MVNMDKNTIKWLRYRYGINDAILEIRFRHRDIGKNTIKRIIEMAMW